MIELTLKLAPNWALPHFIVAASRLRDVKLEALDLRLVRGRPQLRVVNAKGSGACIKDARKALQIGIKADPDHCLALFLQAVVEVSAQRSWKTAISHSQKVLRLNPEFPSVVKQAHFLLATGLLGEGKLADAQQAYRAWLAQIDDPEQIAFAERTILRIGEVLAAQRTGAAR